MLVVFFIGEFNQISSVVLDAHPPHLFSTTRIALSYKDKILLHLMSLRLVNTIVLLMPLSKLIQLNGYDTSRNNDSNKWK